MDPVVPTLRSGTGELLKEKESIAAYLVAFMFMNPGETSTHFPGIMSFRNMEAYHGSNRDGLLTDISQSLQRALDNIFPSAGIRVNASYENIDEKTYRIILAINNPDGTGVIPAKLVKINGDSIEIL